MSEDEGKTVIDTSSRDNKPNPVVNPESGKKRDGVYIIVIILMLLGAGYMAYLLSESKKQLNTCSNDKSALEAEIASLNEMMYAQGVDVGADVKQNLESAKGDKRRYASKEMKLEKEAETLRSIMKDYIRTIDSLNTANGVLTENLNSTLADLDQMT